jgi:hypothetical protein
VGDAVSQYVQDNMSAWTAAAGEAAGVPFAPVSGHDFSGPVGNDPHDGRDHFSRKRLGDSTSLSMDFCLADWICLIGTEIIEFDKNRVAWVECDIDDWKRDLSVRHVMTSGKCRR